MVRRVQRRIVLRALASGMLVAAASLAAPAFALAQAPAVRYLVPEVGPASGGTEVTIAGSSFTGATAVSFGGTAAAGFTNVDDNTIKALLPPHAPGNVDVTVTTASGTSPTSSSDTFTFVDTSSGSWSPGGVLGDPRTGQMTTTLPGGRILIVGGADASGSTTSAELYDPATRIFSPTGSLSDGVIGETATLLNDGKVLVVGLAFGTSGLVPTAELYDPSTGTWTPTANNPVDTLAFAAALLQDGRVLVAGGSNPSTLALAEIYDPTTNMWSATGNLSVPRQQFTLTTLPNGKVLAAGGRGKFGVPSAVSDLYDPSAGTWSSCDVLTASADCPGPMTTTDFGQTATLLQNGKVLAAGGQIHDGLRTNSAELYNPATGLWSNTGSLAEARNQHTATLLPDGRVLVTGGIGSDPAGAPLASSELYDPTTGTWSNTGFLQTARSTHTASLLPNGQVLVVGGYGLNQQILGSAELFTLTPPAASNPIPTPIPIPTPTPAPTPTPKPTPAPSSSPLFPGMGLPKANLSGFKLSVRLTRAGKSRVFAIHGALRLPNSIPASKRSLVCRGSVAVAVRRGHHTGGRRTVRLRSDCSFSTTLVVPTSRLGSQGRYGATARFVGNKYLNARSQTVTIR